MKKYLPEKKYLATIPIKKSNLQWNQKIDQQISFYHPSIFSFINLTKNFGNSSLDWNYPNHGKLWTYNLNYFDFLHQPTMDKSQGISLIKNYISKYSEAKDGKESAPTAIRIINWVKFLAIYNVEDKEVDFILWQDRCRLLDNIEYHLMANHLMEDAFGLLFVSHYFKDYDTYKKAIDILYKELNEQILNDGAHFELSPMYHQLILFRILDAINLIKHNALWKDKLLECLVEKAATMLGWLFEMKFENGYIPLLNDSANNIYPTVDNLYKYALALDIKPEKIQLNESGYRKFKTNKFECLVDIGHIGPSYQPGHAHADTFNYLLHIYQKPFLVDTGISTYNISERRLYERGTTAHNTVLIDESNSSDIWSGFRVGRRANIVSCIIQDNAIEATHDGYKNINIHHKRKWTWADLELKIQDEIIGNDSKVGTAFLHFHKDVILDRVSDYVYDTNYCRILFSHAIDVSIEECYYAEEFNKLITSKKMIIKFKKALTTTFQIN
jgi:uncharacterized heparinase superfamily protein